MNYFLGLSEHLGLQKWIVQSGYQMQILLAVLYTFLMVLVWRVCQMIKTLSSVDHFLISYQLFQLNSVALTLGGLKGSIPY